MKTKIVLFTGLLLACGQVFAQGEIDALRMSRNDLAGTARGQAMGGAFGALGGDVTGITINPAGLGVYTRSELSTSLSFTNARDNTDWNGITRKENQFKVNFETLSYIAALEMDNVSMPVFNVGFSYNRLKNFNRRYNASTGGMGTSLTDYIEVRTNGDDYTIGDGWADYYSSKAPWLSILGYDGKLIVPTGTDTYGAPLPKGEKVDPALWVSERGSINNYDFSFATNIEDEWYFGVDFSLTDIEYKVSTNYLEDFPLGPGGENYGINLDNTLATDGSGYQFKLGAIWKPLDELRVGVAYHSPTWYQMTDYFYGKTKADYADIEGGTSLKASTPLPPDDVTDYYFHTPYSWTFSLAGVISDFGIVSVDYELKDYTSMNISNLNGVDMEANDYIDADFKVASTLRAGAEVRFTPQFSGRLGYAWLQNPYEKTFRDGWREAIIVGTIPNFTIEGNTQYFTAGVGYKFTPSTYLDLACVYQTRKDNLYAFPSVWDADGKSLVASEPATLNHSVLKTMVTLGYKF
ncbi:hemin receptor [Bacteroidia bacterium]|nr:hemin receptor [Bacteroidia bacterium]